MSNMLEGLPLELRVEILRFLTPEQRRKVKLVSTTFNKDCHHRFFANDYPEPRVYSYLSQRSESFKSSTNTFKINMAKALLSSIKKLKNCDDDNKLKLLYSHVIELAALKIANQIFEASIFGIWFRASDFDKLLDSLIKDGVNGLIDGFSCAKDEEKKQSEEIFVTIQDLCSPQSQSKFMLGYFKAKIHPCSDKLIGLIKKQAKKYIEEFDLKQKAYMTLPRSTVRVDSFNFMESLDKTASIISNCVSEKLQNTSAKVSDATYHFLAK